MSAQAPEQPMADAMPTDAPPTRRRPSAWRRFWRAYGLACLFVIAMIVIWQLWIKIFDVPHSVPRRPGS